MQNKKISPIFSYSFLCTITALFALELHFYDSFWSVITVAVLLTDINVHPVKKGLWRLIGTLSGAVIGILLTAVFINDNFIRLLSIFVITLITAHFSLTNRYSYAYILGGVTAFLVIFSSWDSASQVINIAVWRSVEVALGILVVMIYGLWFENDRQTIKKEMVKKNSVFKHYYFVAISCTLTTLICLLMHWFGGAIGVVSAFIVSVIEESEQKIQKAFERLSGCFIGAVLGLGVCVFLIKDLFTVLFFIFLGSLFFTYIHFRSPNNAYMKLQMFVAYLIAILPATDHSTANIAPVLERLAGILVGISIPVLLNTLCQGVRSLAFRLR